MCKWNNTKVLEVKGVPRDIDSCIFNLVKVLNEHYKTTVACCCGHEKQPSRISFDDGTEMILCTHDQAQQISKLFPPIN
uniref:Uncharacterized protein n=1 Tax=viral metagenome TaxID=1070528 RepID=A0A6H1ZHQ9_9ZZZZ